MLPTDMALVQDSTFKAHVTLFASDRSAFFDQFAASFSRLLELGVPGFVDYRALTTTIKALLPDPTHDDGTWGPAFIRLAWHSSGLVELSQDVASVESS
jgi:catalase (peroxidase I)